MILMRFNSAGRSKFDSFLKKIKINIEKDNNYCLSDDDKDILREILSNNYLENYNNEHISFFENDEFKIDDKFTVIGYIHKKFFKANNVTIDILEDNAFWDMITASWLLNASKLPRADISNWGTLNVFEDRYLNRHPFKGPSILYNYIYSDNNNVISEEALRYFLSGSITERGDILEQLFYPKWIVSNVYVLNAIYEYINEKSLNLSDLRFIINDLTQLSAKIDFDSIRDSNKIKKLITIFN